MKIVLFVIVTVMLALAIFTAANWSVLTAPTPLSFLLLELEGPLGVILLGIMLSLVVLVVGYALLLRTTWLVESRRLNRQLEEQREVAEKAESSRIVALQKMLELELEHLNTTLQQISETGVARIESAEKTVVKTIEDSGNSLMAHIGYLDDKLKGGS